MGALKEESEELAVKQCASSGFVDNVQDIEISTEINETA